MGNDKARDDGVSAEMTAEEFAEELGLAEEQEASTIEELGYWHDEEMRAKLRAWAVARGWNVGGYGLSHSAAETTGCDQAETRAGGVVSLPVAKGSAGGA